MTTYYVRKTGSNANSGLSPALAKLTIQAGVNTMARGDTLYVGAGVYVEGIAISKVGAGMTFIRGDWDGSQTGDAGEIRVTGWTNNTTLASTVSLNFHNSSHWTVTHLTVEGGSPADQNCLYIDGSSTDFLFEDCTFLGSQSSDGPAYMIAPASTISVAATFKRCRFVGGLYAVRATQFGTGADQATLFQNCLLWQLVGNAAIIVEQGGGFTLDHCTIIGGIWAAAGATTSPVAITVRNSLIMGLQGFSASSIDAAVAGQVVEDYNQFNYSDQIEYGANVTPGANSKTALSRNARFLFGQETSWGAISRPFMTPAVGSGLLGWGDSGSGVTDDLLGGIRPGSGTGVVNAVGALERGNSFVKETTTVYAGSVGLSCTGPGYQDFDLPVAQATTKVRVHFRWDATYAGTKPQLRILNGGEAGVSDTSSTAIGSSGAWETLEIILAPTSAGRVTVRIQSNDTNGAGKMYSDLPVAA